jgi:SAM-dependent methyltransferase
VPAAPPGRAEIFDGFAELYDEVRPGYPTSLVDEIHERARLIAPAAILEVGCGTGKATRLFAARGHRITAVEPGPRMATLAAEHCRAWPAVRIEIARFEDWPLPKEPFELVMSAQAFHWVDPEVGFPKTAKALRPGGALAVFGNKPVAWEPALRADLDAIYARHMPEEPWFMVRGKSTDPLAERIEASGCFRDLVESVHPWTDRRSAEAYTQLLRTHSDHADLPAAARDALLGEVREAIEAHGGEIAVEQEARLFFALSLD